MPSNEPDFFRIIEVLGRHEVRYVLVGGICALLHGAPISTFDMDIVHAQTPDDLPRLQAALAELEAVYRHQAHRRLAPGPSHLLSPGHQLLLTNAGPLDLLGTIGAGRGYAALLSASQEIEVQGQRLRLLDLDELIRSKEVAGRDKDHAVLPILRHVLRMQTEPRE